jgi:hypothetical protein
MDEDTNQFSTNWDACCAGCKITVGQIVDGRFAHDPECRQPLRIERGALACCRCGGSLDARPRPAVELPVTVEMTRPMPLAVARNSRR